MKSMKELRKIHKPVKQYSCTFLERYEELFTPIRLDNLIVLEIGVGGYKNPDKGGESLRLWSEFFPNSTIIGVDMHHKNLEFTRGNVYFHQGSQTDENFLNKLAKDYGGFDIVIDDASHITANTIQTFEILWPKTRQFYVVEDLHMKKAQGAAAYFESISGTDFNTKHLCVIRRER